MITIRPLWLLAIVPLAMPRAIGGAAKLLRAHHAK